MLRRGASTCDIMGKSCPTSVPWFEVEDVLVPVFPSHGPGVHIREDDKYTETMNSYQGIKLGNLFEGVTRNIMLLQYPYPRKEIKLFKFIPPYSGTR